MLLDLKYLLTLIYIFGLQYVASIEVIGAGATFPAAVYSNAMTVYESINASVSMSYAGIGSGGGKCRIEDWAAKCGGDMTEPYYIDFAGSDSRLTDADYLEYPDLQMYPAMAGAIVPVVHLPELAGEELILSTSVLVSIFLQDITNWNHSSIRALQTDTVNNLLPDRAIEVVVRGDKSGATEIFKSSLCAFDAAFKTQIGCSDSITWTSVTPTFVKTNEGLGFYVLNTEYSIGYVGLGLARHYGLTVPAIQKTAGIVRASIESLQFAVAEKGLDFGGYGDDENRLTASIVNAVGSKAWPICGYTYLVMRKDTLRRNATCDNRRATFDFWDWFYESDIVAQIISDEYFAPLTSNVQEFVLKRFHADMRCEGTRLYEQEQLTDVDVKAPDYMNYLFNNLFFPSYLAKDITLNTSFNQLDVDRTFDGQQDIMYIDLDSKVNEDSVSDGVVFPFALMSYSVFYNLCGKDQSCSLGAVQPTVVLDVEILMGIFSGRIRYWNDSDIVELNSWLTTVFEPINVFSIPMDSIQMESLKLLFQEYDSQFEFDSSVWTEVESDAVARAKVYSVAYSLIITPTVGTKESLCREVTLRNENGNLLQPNVSSLQQCLSTEHDGVCYPLHSQLNMVTKKAYEGDCSFEGPIRQTVNFVQWMTEQTLLLEYSGLAELMTVDPENTRKLLEKITCNGDSIFGVSEDEHYLPVTFVILCNGLAALIVVVTVACMVLMTIHRNKKLIKNSQILFMQLILFGCVVSACAIYPMGIDDRNSDMTDESLDAACMSQVWLYCVGFCITFAALFVKTWRVKSIVMNSSLRKKAVTMYDVLPMFALLLVVESVILIAWQLVSPLQWQRVDDSVDHDGNVTSSHGLCTSDHAVSFLIPLLAFQVGAYVYGNILAFQTRGIDSSFAESQYIAMCMLSSMQTFVLTVPLVYLLRNDPLTLYLMKVLSVLLQIVSVIAIVIGPKIHGIFFPPQIVPKSGTVSSTSNYSSYAIARGSRYNSSQADNSKLESALDSHHIPVSRLEPNIEHNSSRSQHESEMN